MPLRAVGRDPQPLRDLRIRQTFPHQLEDLVLARRQDIRILRPSTLSHTENPSRMRADLPYPPTDAGTRGALAPPNVTTANGPSFPLVITSLAPATVMSTVRIRCRAQTARSHPPAAIDRTFRPRRARLRLDQGRCRCLRRLPQ